MSLPQAMSQLSGTVTIGTGGMYSTIGAALNEINAYGLSGHVIFELEAGVYNESIYLSNITDLTKDSTLTFRSTDGPSAAIIRSLNNNPTNALVSLINCPFITFDGIRFVIEQQNIWFVEATGCHNFELNNCTFSEPLLSSTSFGNAGLVSVTESNHVYIDSTEIPRRLYVNNDTLVVVTDSEIRRGHYSQSSITHTVFASNCDSLYISNSIISEYSIGGHAQTAEIINCDVAGIGLPGNAPQSGILIKDNYVQGFIRINTGKVINNTVTNPHASSACIWINNGDSCIVDRNVVYPRMEKGIYAPIGSGLITNNMVLDTWDNTYVFDRNGIDVAGDFYVSHNSVFMNNVTVDNEAAGIKILGDSEVVINNIVYIEHPIATSLNVTTGNTFTSENNILMNASGPLASMLGTLFYTLQQWNASSSQDNLSIAISPSFIGHDDLHLTSSSGILLAGYSDSVVYDIDSEVRQVTTHVGADQVFNVSLFNENKSSLQLFPNPTNDYFFIDGLVDNGTETTIKIYKITGEEVERIEDYDTNTPILLPYKGIYIVRIDQGTGEEIILKVSRPY